MKNCQLKETHFQAEGKGSSRLWGKALDLLLFASLPHTFFTILPLQGKFRKQIVEHKNSNAHFIEKERDASSGNEKDLELIKSKQDYCPLTYFVLQRFPGHMISRGLLPIYILWQRSKNVQHLHIILVANGWLPIYIFCVWSQLGSGCANTYGRHIRAAINPVRNVQSEKQKIKHKGDTNKNTSTRETHPVCNQPHSKCAK